MRFVERYGACETVPDRELDVQTDGRAQERHPGVCDEISDVQLLLDALEGGSRVAAISLPCVLGTPVLKIGKFTRAAQPTGLDSCLWCAMQITAAQLTAAVAGHQTHPRRRRDQRQKATHAKSLDTPKGGT